MASNENNKRQSITSKKGLQELGLSNQKDKTDDAKKKVVFKKIIVVFSGHRRQEACLTSGKTIVAGS